MSSRYSLYKFYDKENIPFNIEEYSYFKFGDTYFAEMFAKELFNGFIEEYGDWIISNEEITIIPSPYHSIPTASNYLCKYFKEQLNKFLFKYHKKSCVESKIYRKQTYIEDYGNMNYDQRIELISNDTYYIDKYFINGKACIFLDDIKITGSHEFIIKKILNDNHINGSFIFVYFAELCNKLINPNVENFINYSAIKNFEDIINISKRSSFKFNTRNVKFILHLSKSEFLSIYEIFSSKQKKQFFDLVISNNYHQINAYQSNIKFINQ